MRHTTGRHRRRHRTLTGRLRAAVAAPLATVLAFVLVPDRPKEEPTSITPPPEPARPPAPPATATAYEPEPPDTGGPDEVGGALVRPYLSRSPVPPPRRCTGGDLLAAPTGQPPDEPDELATVIRAYLGTADRAGASFPAGRRTR